MEEAVERFSSFIVWYHMCRIAMFSAFVSFTGNYVTIIAIACDRFVCIRYPYFYRQTIIVRKMKLYILFVWFIIVVCILMQIILLENGDFRTSPSRLCIWTNYFTTKGKTFLRIPFLICTATTTVLCLGVMYNAKTRLKGVKTTSVIVVSGPAGTSSTSKNSATTCITSKGLRRQSKVTKMTGLVMGTYYALYLPFGLDSYFKYDPKISFYTLYTFRFIFYMNALVNPFIYAGQSPEFSAAYRR